MRASCRPFSRWPLAPHAAIQAASATVAVLGLAAVLYQWTTLPVLHKLFVGLFLLLVVDSALLLVHLALDLTGRRWRRGVAALCLLAMSTPLAAGYGTFALGLLL